MAAANDLLIAAAFDFDGGAWFAPLQHRIVAALAPGKAGSVRNGTAGGAFFAARADGPLGAAAAKPKEFVPHCGEDGSLIVMAGRIQDRAELAVRHGLDPALNDTALYARLFARHGDRCDRLIHGDYAVIQWYPQNQQVRLARSATSFCPLHYWRDGNRLVVSSIPRALFSAGMDVRIDDAKLGDALLLNYRDATRSWYRGSCRVACGTFELHGPDRTVRQRFWSVENVPQVLFARDEDYVEAVDEQFCRATRAELEGVSRPAIALSGGLDSQCVASYILSEGSADLRLPAFTGVPQAGWYCDGRRSSFGDESGHVRALAAMNPQIEPHFISGEQHRFGDQLEKMAMLSGWPVRNESNMHWIHEAYAGAGAMGCDVLFFGGAGNTGLSYDGLTGYPTWLRRGQWLRLARELGASADPRPLWRRAISLALMPNLPLSLRRSIDNIRGLKPSPFTSWCPMAEHFARSSGALQRARAAQFDPYFYPSPNSREWRARVLDDLFSESAEIELGLRLLHGVGYRDPTLYRPLLELCIGIGDEQYLRGGTDRWLARRLLKGRVPEMVRLECRAGRQAADWALRMAAERDALTAELEGMRADPWLAERFDLERLTSDFRAWPGTDGPAARYPLKIGAAVASAISTARFVRYASGRNVG
ncbi:MAG: hypothetical protein C0510_05945 [Erythrobacter sp.]|nr:hypothetical protein [Erythrobacter sp.]